MPTRKEPQIPLSDVVHLLSGKKKRKATKKVTRKKAPAVAAPQYVNPSQRYTGMSSFSFVPSMVNPAPPPFIQPLQQARGQTININTNYDPDRHRVMVETDSKSGVFPTEINPNDIVPRISSRRLIGGNAQPDLISSSLPPAPAPLQFSNPVAHLQQSFGREVVPSAFYDPLRPGGRPMPPDLVEEKYGDEMLQADAMMPPIDPGNLQSEQQFEELYAPQPRRLTRLTRRNPVTGALEQYARGGVLPMKDYPVNRYMNGGFVTKPYFDRMIIPPGNPRDHYRGREHLLRELEA